MSVARSDTVASVLRDARARGVDRLDAQLLLARVLNRPRSWLLAHDDAPLAIADAACFATDVARRADGVPLAYLLGEKEFRGLALRVTPDVLVPRPDTETLVEWALDLLARFGGSRWHDPEACDAAAARPAGAAPLRVADLGTGSGAIALAVAHACAEAGCPAEVCAVDASAAALEVARDNARRLGIGGIEWLHGDWWEPLAGRRFDLALSNPPYVAAGDAHLAALRHEPLQALASGADGLDDLRRVVGAAAPHLAPQGWLLVEHGHDQGGAVRVLLGRHGFTAVATRADLAGRERCSGGTVAAPA